MRTGVSTRDLYDSLRYKLGLEWIAGQTGAARNLRGDFPNAGSQGLAGPLNCIHPNRVQLIGQEELAYLSGLEPDFLLDMIEKLFLAQPAAVLLADGIAADDRLIDGAERSATPLLRSSLPHRSLLNDLHYYLSQALAERETQHGVFMEVLGTGVLLTGSAAVGKSELALELISRGHRLIADDAPEFARFAPDTISGSCPALLQDFLEVRGLGILNIRAMFGDSAIKRRQDLQFIIHLQRMKEQELQEIDRLQGSFSTQTILGLTVPKVTLPVATGRELAILVEAAVRQYILLQKGYDATERFINRQQEAIESSGARPTPD